MIEVNVVGDSLFRRRLCSDEDLFDTPQFIRTITFKYGEEEFVVQPDEFGDIQITVNNAAAEDTILRVRNTVDGIRLSTVGEEL